MISLEKYSELIKIPVSEIKSKSRKKSNVTARQVYSFYLKSFGFTLNEIGKIIKIDHATVLHGIKKTVDLIRLNDKYIINFLNALFMDKKIKSIEKGYGNQIVIYTTEIILDLSTIVVHVVDEIVEESKPLTSKDWMRVYRCYKNGKLYNEIEANSGLTIIYE